MISTGAGHDLHRRSAIVDTIRKLLAQLPVGGDIRIAPARCVGILIVAYAFAMMAHRR